MQTVTEWGPWRLRRRVLPQHTDHAGVMWHGAYLAWLEEARVEALAAVGLAYCDLSARGLELPVVHLTLDFRQPLMHGDRVEVHSAVLPRQGVKLCWSSCFVAPCGAKAAVAQVDLVLVERGLAGGGAAGPALRLLRRWPADLAAAAAALARGPG
jgi:acyl-CoA thioester hydrolase